MVIFMTTLVMALYTLMRWKVSLVSVLLAASFYIFIEGWLLSSCLAKVRGDQGVINF